MSESNTGDIFSSLLSNPEMLSNIAKLLSNTQSAPAAETAESAGGGGSGTSAPDMSGILSAALSNPQLMAALPKMLGALSSMSKTTPEPPVDTTEKEAAQSTAAVPDLSGLGAILPALAGGVGDFKKPPRPTDRRSALLLALKPYMSHDKSEMIDTIVRIIEIMSLIK